MGQFGCDLSEVALKNLPKRLTSKLNTRAQMALVPLAWIELDRWSRFSRIFENVLDHLHGPLRIGLIEVDRAQIVQNGFH